MENCEAPRRRRRRTRLANPSASPISPFSIRPPPTFSLTSKHLLPSRTDSAGENADGPLSPPVCAVRKRKFPETGAVGWPRVVRLWNLRALADFAMQAERRIVEERVKHVTVVSHKTSALGRERVGRRGDLSATAGRRHVRFGVRCRVGKMEARRR